MTSGHGERNRVPNELVPLAAELARLGYAVSHADVNASFGNFIVTFVSDKNVFSVVRDRGQYHVDHANQSELERVGLWRSFLGVYSLTQPLLAWAKDANAA